MENKEKPIIATNIDNLLIEHSAFIEPHKNWFERVIIKTKDDSLRKWIGREDYFMGVNEAMKKILPNASKEERTSQARKWYQEDVIEYIKIHPETIKKDNLEKLMKLKENYKLILITTNTKKYINKILKISKLDKVYDKIVASESEEEPDKEKLLEILIRKYGKPKYYITGKLEEDINTIFKQKGIENISINEIDRLTN